MKTTDYVKRNEVISTIERIMWEEQGEGFINLTHYARSLHDAIKSMDAVDAAPVVHGGWLFDCDMDRYCSCCGRMAPMPYFELEQICAPYCPFCGARMDLEEQW